MFSSQISWKNDKSLIEVNRNFKRRGTNTIFCKIVYYVIILGFFESFQNFYSFYRILNSCYNLLQINLMQFFLARQFNDITYRVPH